MRVGESVRDIDFERSVDDKEEVFTHGMLDILKCVASIGRYDSEYCRI